MPSVSRSNSAMATAPSHMDVKGSITGYLNSKNVPPTTQWLRSFMPSIRLNTPLVALQKTALFRILATDLTQSVQSTSQASQLPAGVSGPDIRERRLAGPIIVQVLDVEDISRSCWSQVEAIEAQERGETTKGREIIRVTADETNSDQNAPTINAGAGPHKLLLQDAKGTKIYGMELETVSGLGVQMSIGTKLVLRDVIVARGVILLAPKSVDVLGGKVVAWDEKWRKDRKENLKRKAGMSEQG